MTVTINGTDGIDLENYNLDEDSSGNLIIIDPDGNTVFTYDNTANEWQLGDSLDAQSNDISNVGALSTGNLTVNSWPSQNNRELLDYQQLSGDPVNLTISDIGRGDTQNRIIIDVQRYIDGDTQTPLEVIIGGYGDGNYDYLSMDETGTISSNTGENSFKLFNPSGTGKETGGGTFRLFNPTSSNTPGIYGNGVLSENGVGDVMMRSTSRSFPNDPFDLTIRASASGSDSLSFDCAVWELNPRFDI